MCSVTGNIFVYELWSCKDYMDFLESLDGERDLERDADLPLERERERERERLREPDLGERERVRRRDLDRLKHSYKQVINYAT